MQNQNKNLWKKLTAETSAKTKSQMKVSELEHDLQILGVDTFSVASQNQQIESPIPTFGQKLSIKLNKKSGECQSFSFGCEMLQEVKNFEDLLKQSVLLKGSCQSLSELLPFIFTGVEGGKTGNELKGQSFGSKLISYLKENKKMNQWIKLTLKAYKDQLNRQKSIFQNMITKIIENSESRYSHEKSQFNENMENLKKQNYFLLQKQKIFEKRSLSLEKEVDHLTKLINLDKTKTGNFNMRIFQLTEQLNSKTKENGALKNRCDKLEAQLLKVVHSLSSRHKNIPLYESSPQNLKDLAELNGSKLSKRGSTYTEDNQESPEQYEVSKSSAMQKFKSLSTIDSCSFKKIGKEKIYKNESQDQKMLCKKIKSEQDYLDLSQQFEKDKRRFSVSTNCTSINAQNMPRNSYQGVSGFIQNPKLSMQIEKMKNNLSLQMSIIKSTK